MKAEIIYIRALSFGHSGIDISLVGEVLLFECSLPDQVAIVIPYNESDTVILKKCDIRTCFHDPKTNLISLLLSKPLEFSFLNQGSLTITCQLSVDDLHPKLLALSKQDKSEYKIFLDFALNNFHAMEFKRMKDTVSQKLARNLQKIPSSKAPITPNRWKEEKFKVFLRSYVQFLSKNQLNERDFKKLVRSQGNVADFFRETLLIDDPTNLLASFEGFQNNRFCNNANCLKATHKKCSACREVAYCSMECHIQIWATHKSYCKDVINQRKRYEKPHQTILENLLKQFTKVSSPVPFEVFHHELETVLYVVLFPVLEETNKLDSTLYPLLYGKNKTTCIAELKTLKKRQYNKMTKNLNAKEIILQFSESWKVDFNAILILFKAIV